MTYKIKHITPCKRKMKLIEAIGGEIVDKEIPTNPFDHPFRKNARVYPAETKQEYGIPGLNPRLESAIVFPKWGDPLEADLVLSVSPDNIVLFDEASILLEQETGPVLPDKREQIYYYWLSKVIEHRKICLAYVATNHKYEKDYFIVEVDGFCLKVKLLIYDEEKIYEILNSLMDKDFSKELFDVHDYVRFIQCIVHAQKPYAKDVCEKLISIFRSITEITSVKDYEELYIELCRIIKYHFKDDLNKTKELIIMTTEVLREDMLGKAPKLYSDREALVKLEQETRELKEQYMKTMMNAEKENAKQKQKYENKTTELKQKYENKTTELKQEIEKLKEQLKKYEEDE